MMGPAACRPSCAPSAHGIRRRATLHALIVLAVAVAAGEGAASADGQVHDLVSGDFADAIRANGLSFVEFYAPWCGHCKKLVPEWEKTAQLCQEAGVMVAKVDSIAEKALAQEHEVQSFPTLRLFRKNPKVSVKYEGPRTGDKMAEWAKGKGNEKLLQSAGSSADAVKSWASAKPVAIVGLSSGDESQDAKMRKVLEDVSFALNPHMPGGDVPVGEASAIDAAFLEGLGGSADLNLPSVALIRDFDFEEKVLFFTPEGGWKKGYDPLMKWIAAKRVAALIPGSEQTEKFFLQEIEPGNGLVLYFGEDEELRRSLHELAVQFAAEKRLKFVHLKSNDFGESLGKSVSLTKSDFPEVALWEFGETEDADKVFRLSQQPSAAGGLLKPAVEAFVKDWQNGALSAEKDPVTALTSDTFDSIVINSQKDVLVEFYAPWCGHCKALAPEYKLVAQHYASDEGVEIVKMDATKHKHSSADIKSYPTLKLYAQGKKSSPIDGEFKTTRNKAGIIDFVENNRATGSKSGKGKKKQAEDKAAAAEPAQSQPAPPSPPPSQSKPATTLPKAASGVWIFDDSMDPQSRGKELSPEMAQSLNGFTLVQVGDLGLLLSPGDGGTRAVRHFPDAASAKAHVSSIKAKSPPPSEVKQVTVPAPGALPCPADADLNNCKAWCDGVWEGEGEVRTTLGGKSCSELPATAPIQERPSCMCYDSDYRVQIAMCVSPCKGASEPKGADGGSGTCAAGDKSCAAAPAFAATGSSADKRYVLYDTKYGEGFNLQREVYPRAGWIVAQVNKALDAQCGTDLTGKCARWVLVLPPWCQVVHWWTGPDHVPWKTFFDSKALNSSQVPVIEFEEYVRQVGRQKVDLAVSFETDKLKAKKEKMKDGLSKFVGFADSPGECATKYSKALEFQKLPSGELQVVYAGHCERGLAAKDVKCAALDGPWPQGVSDMLSSLDGSVASVLLKNYDYLLSPENSELDGLGLRESMFFSEELRQVGDEFISSALKGEKYLAAHCRRTDFLRARQKTTPDVSNIAMKLNEVLEQQGLKQVFIATDAQDDLRAELEKQVKASVVFYDEKHGAVKFDHKGKQAIVETWIAARADFFVGTIESRFTMSIQLERSFLGKPHQSSEQEFCKDYKEGGKPCKAPPYRHTSRPGMFRDPYLLK